jgi:hypothetical protein
MLFLFFPFADTPFPRIMFPEMAGYLILRDKHILFITN